MTKVRKVSSSTMTALLDNMNQVHFIDGIDVVDIVASDSTIAIVTIDKIAFAIDRSNLNEIINNI